MSASARFVSVLRDCEKVMRSAIAEASAAAEPERLNQLVKWLGEIQRIATEASGSANASTQLAAPHVPEQRVDRAGRTPGQKSYPRFFNQADALVKVGWSKKAKEEYEHKAPIRAVTSVVAALAEVGRGGKKISMDKVIPVREDSSGAAVPDYQTYLALAWLRSLGLVVQHGRQGYTLKKGEDFTAAVKREWAKLEQR